MAKTETKHVHLYEESDCSIGQDIPISGQAVAKWRFWPHISSDSFQ